MQNSASLDSSILRSGRIYRRVSDPNISTTTQDAPPPAPITTQPSPGVFQTFSHRSSPDILSAQEISDDFPTSPDNFHKSIPLLLNHIVEVALAQAIEEKPCIPQQDQDSQRESEQDNQSAQVPVTLSIDSRVPSCPITPSQSNIRRKSDNHFLDISSSNSSGHSPAIHISNFLGSFARRRNKGH